MIIVSSILRANDPEGEAITISNATAEALESAGILEFDRELLLEDGHVLVNIYRKAD